MSSLAFQVLHQRCFTQSSDADEERRTQTTSGPNTFLAVICAEEEYEASDDRDNPRESGVGGD